MKILVVLFFFFVLPLWSPPTCFIYFLGVFHHVVIDRLQSLRHVWRQSIPIESWLLADRRWCVSSESGLQQPLLTTTTKIRGIKKKERPTPKKQYGEEEEEEEKKEASEMRFECNKTTTKAFSNHFGALRLIAWLARTARSYMCIGRAGGAAVERIGMVVGKEEVERKKERKERKERKRKRSGMNHATGTDPFDSCFHSVPRFSFTSFSLSLSLSPPSSIPSIFMYTIRRLSDRYSFPVVCRLETSLSLVLLSVAPLLYYYYISFFFQN